MQINAQGYKSIAELIHGYLEEIELVPYDELPTDNEIVRKLKKCNFIKNGITTQQLDCVNENECAVFIIYDRSKTTDENFHAIMEQPLDEGERITLHIVLLSTSVEELLELEKAKNDIIEKAKWWTQNRKTDRKKSLIRFCVMHAPERTTKSFSIDINSRIRSLHYTSKNEDSIVIESDVYIAKLFDIVQMYSKIGAELFERNVRYHIKDILNVESEIQNTLNSCPAEFFNFNNGIAMQITDVANLDQRNESDIQITYAQKGDVSVINGAQTISAAAEFFFQPLGNDPKSEEKRNIIERAKKEAYVILRIFYPPKGTSKDCLLSFEQISISLNRQKPINPIDVQYTCREVIIINALFEQNLGNPYYFRLLKRGQILPGRFQYQLSEFGRIVRAYFCNEPGHARADSTEDIIRHLTSTSDSDEAKELNTIYAPFEMQPFDNDLFMQWYKPVNFAFALSKVYIAVDKAYRKQTDIIENVRNVLSNGRYFYIAYTVRCLNAHIAGDNKKQDYSSFMYNAEVVKDNRETFEHSILQFASHVAQFGVVYLKNRKNNRTILGSNDFKTEEFYKEWCVFAEKDDAINEWIQELLKIIDKSESDN